VLALAAATGAGAAARAQTPTDPAAFGLPSGAQENVSGRTETSKDFTLPDGTSARLLFTRPIHYQDALGQWQDVDLSFHDDGQDGQIVDRHPSLRVHVPGRSGAIEVTDTAGDGVRWLTSPAMTIHGRQAHYEDAQGATWTYTTTPSGVKHQATVTNSRGPYTYRFAYQLLGDEPSPPNTPASPRTFAVDAAGNAAAGSVEVPRATVKDANGIEHLAGPWRVQGQVLAFDFDDTDIPTPYTIDPTTITIYKSAQVNNWRGTCWASSWSNARNGICDTFTYSSDSPLELGDSFEASTYRSSRYFVAFDTSVLRTTDSIKLVYLEMAFQVNQAATGFTVKIRDFQWDKKDDQAIWQGCLTASSADGDWYSITAELSTDTKYDSIGLNKGDNIIRNGSTKYCLLSDRDTDRYQTAPTGAEYIDVYASGATFEDGTSAEPVLVVQYDPAPTPTPTLPRTATKTRTATSTPTQNLTPGTATPTPTPTPLCQPNVICPSSPCTITQSTTVGSGCNLDWSGKSVTINSGAVLQDPDGGSSLSIEAASLTVNGTLKARGGDISITTTNDFTTAGSGTIDVKDGGSVTINASGDCTLNGTTITADAITTGMYGGDISITCLSVIGGSALSANGAGNSSLEGDGGWITVNATADKVVLSGNINANGAGTTSWGGEVDISAATRLTTGKDINAQGTSGGSGGDIFLFAGGPATIEGAAALTATSGGGDPGEGGWIFVGADSIIVAGALNASGSTQYGGIGGGIDIFSGSGAITILCTGSLSSNGGGAGAEGGYIWVDSGGNVDVTDCTASGNAWGGEVDIGGQGTVNMSGPVDVTSSAAGSVGGDIWVSAAGDLNTAPGTTLRAYASGSGSTDGSISLEGCNVNLAGNLNSVYASHTGGGGNSVTYHGYLAAVSTVSMNTDNGSQNQLVCPCSIWGCNACEHDPVFLGTSSPAYTVSKQQLPLCD
jgi:hypothetical protein